MNDWTLSSQADLCKQFFFFLPTDVLHIVGITLRLGITLQHIIQVTFRATD